MSARPNTSKGTVLALACAAQFMVILDVAIVNVALPTIQRDLHISKSTLEWIVVAYGLVLGGFVLLGGRLADRIGRRRVLLTGLTLFTSASLLAGAAGSAELLIGARALQGLGAALIPPAALAIIAVTFNEGAERNRAIGIYGAVTGISASVGVLASGLITDGPGWRWVFLLNVPLGIVLILTATAFLDRDSRDSQANDRFDLAGALTLTSGLMLLVYATNRSAIDGWDSQSAVGSFAVSFAMLTAFVAIELRSRSPLLPGAVFRNRVLVASNIAAFFTFGGFLTFIFLGSQFMQHVLGYSPTQTGLAWLATTVPSFFAAAISGGKLVPAIGVRRVLMGGMSLLAITAVMMTRISPRAHFATATLPALLLAGVAGGVSAPAATIGALSGAAESISGTAAGLLETMREIGGAIGVAAVSTVLVSWAGNGTSAANPTAPGQPGTAAFHAAFWVIFAAALTGALTAAIGLPSRPGSPAHSTVAARRRTGLSNNGTAASAEDDLAPASTQSPA